FRAAEVDGIGLYEFGIELVLADDLAQTVADLRATAIPVPIRVLGRKLFDRIRSRSDFLDGAEADPVGLAQGPIDCPGLGHTHLGATDERGNIRRIGVAVTDKASTGSRLVDNGSESVATHCLIGQLTNWLHLHSRAVA